LAGKIFYLRNIFLYRDGDNWKSQQQHSSAQGRQKGRRHPVEKQQTAKVASQKRAAPQHNENASQVVATPRTSKKEARSQLLESSDSDDNVPPAEIQSKKKNVLEVPGEETPPDSSNEEMSLSSDKPMKHHPKKDQPSSTLSHPGY
jgi:hypothetical protein